MIKIAERCSPVRIRIILPLRGLCQQYGQMTAWLDEGRGSARRMTLSDTRGVLNYAMSLYFADATLARVFDAGRIPRCCNGMTGHRFRH
jgi:hypothetical protein